MGKSWEVDSYREGNRVISVRHNMEDDRIDEGDKQEERFQEKAGDGKEDDL